MTDEMRYTADIYPEQEQMMDKQFTASEVRELAKHMESVGWQPESNGYPVCCDEGAARSADMLTAYANLLEMQEKAEPVATVEDQFGFPIMEWIGDAGDRCPVGTKLYTHPSPAPSDAERLADRIMEIIHPHLDTGDSRTAADWAVEIYHAICTHFGEAQPPYELDPAITEKWENGELGRSLEYAQVAQPPAASAMDAMDAARYRWLIKTQNTDCEYHSLEDLAWYALHNLSGEETSNAIDAAMAQENPNG